MKFDFTSFSDLEIFEFRFAVRAEMQKRGLADSVGSMGERIAIDFFRKAKDLPNLQLAPPGTKNVDALSRNGDRYSIKTVCDGSKTGTIYPDSENKDRQLFEFMLIVKISGDWKLRSIHQASWSEFCYARLWDKRMNAWYIGCSNSTLSKLKCLFSES